MAGRLPFAWALLLLAAVAAKEPCSSKETCDISGLDNMDGAEGLGLAQLRAKKSEQDKEEKGKLQPSGAEKDKVQKDVAKKDDKPATQCMVTPVNATIDGHTGIHMKVSIDVPSTGPSYCSYTEEGKSKSKVIPCAECSSQESKDIPKGSYSPQCYVPPANTLNFIMSGVSYYGMYYGTCTWPGVARYTCACNTAEDCDQYGNGPSQCSAPDDSVPCTYLGTAQCLMQDQGGYNFNNYS